MPLGANKAAIMGVAGVSTGDVVLLSTQTADSDTTITFTNLTSTYNHYIFKCYNINPETDNVDFECQFDVASGTSYAQNMTSSIVTSEIARDATQQYFRNWADGQGNGTAYHPLAMEIGFGSAECANGELHVFNPGNSAGTFETNFKSRFHEYHYGGRSWDIFTGGYLMTTTAITNVRFKMSSGDWDGTIKQWGVK